MLLSPESHLSEWWTGGDIGTRPRANEATDV